ncbi:hypothetical protein O185_15535 [Photorhabdus temperata J3]|uniref:Uncharacterized protein n=1 Tax=Photorhabdus temperata J3 TaxID=1389415 RepID=U7R052_PHOTE|nr:hypothetical protein O185_15535 [Photorhabdus temperata J3]
MIERVIALPAKLMSTHLPTLAMSVATVLILLTARFLRPTWPGPLLAMVLTTYVSWQFGLEKQVFRLLAVSAVEGCLLCQCLISNLELCVIWLSHP